MRTAAVAARTTAPPTRTNVRGNFRPGPSPISGCAEVAEPFRLGSSDRAGFGEDLDDGGRGARLIDPDSTRVEGQALDVPVKPHPGDQVVDPDVVNPVLGPQQR